ncbi:hypothetical protein PHYBLDRAFT_67628 [Phycomyces blakesleeanus NRRL 1555(-)]|uniref:Uncharacterized protein n=1 Tax=Phycomyces blakesleeanus (strain ATCC 8743b / DSM 1359 / FGSC 10004 / NBRC 33097 / NRRL 1555) TaxID=763407 RepID=A0A162PVJ0_PHYB8|nr:hypothetical protein PHYBLDRAFT_67628 [Phycomyces blakesleeanus NRRL 1555(-)]OAD74446.1 hypothetical protein PHYBLDRAFT_67628 [Phycomyces blakesleeanus NRRL 1555(-)]|eukprot:XP_018292486.1 hypothetical protein PHYBLDRAFT_67628 [Phycomyces blakesleeanus NRRL 1555(-)]
MDIKKILKPTLGDINTFMPSTLVHSIFNGDCVIWSDESKFMLFDNGGKTRIGKYPKGSYFNSHELSKLDTAIRVERSNILAEIFKTHCMSIPNCIHEMKRVHGGHELLSERRSTKLRRLQWSLDNFKVKAGTKRLEIIEE